MIFINVKVNRGPDDLIKETIAAADYARKMVCRLWVTEMLPKHFQRGAHGDYGYAARSSKYLKDRRKLGKPDLVFTGRSRDRITSPAFRRFTNTKGYTTFRPIIGSDIRYFYMTPSKQPNKPEEMKKVSEQDMQRMDRAFRNLFLSRLQKDRNPVSISTPVTEDLESFVANF